MEKKTSLEAEVAREQAKEIKELKNNIEQMQKQMEDMENIKLDIQHVKKMVDSIRNFQIMRLQPKSQRKLIKRTEDL